MPKSSVSNIDVFLSFDRKPNELCLVLIFSIALVLVFYPELILDLIQWSIDRCGFRNPHSEIVYHGSDELANRIDEATAGSWTQLRVTLAPAALQIALFLCFKRVVKPAAKFLIRVCSLGRLPLFASTAVITFIIIAIECKVIWILLYCAAVRTFEKSESVDFYNQFLPVLQLRNPYVDAKGNQYFQWDHSGKGKDLASLNYRPAMNINTNSQLNQLAEFSSHTFESSYLRHQNDGIHLPCEAVVSIFEDGVDGVVEVTAWWTLDGTVLDTDVDRVHMSMTSYEGWIHWAPLEKESGWPFVRKVFLKRTMDIRRLRPEQFGHYVCHANISGNLSNEPPWQPITRKTVSFNVSSLHVEAYPQLTELLSMPPVSRFTIEILALVIDDEANDVTIEHYVNGVPEHELANADRCRQEVAYILQYFMHPVRRVQRSMFSDLLGHTAVHEEREVCVEQSMYGLHTFVISRTFHNPGTGLEDYVETEYHQRVLVIPEKPRFFSSVNHNAYFAFLNLPDCWASNSTVKSEFCTDKLNHLRERAQFQFQADCIASIIMVFLGIPLYHISCCYLIIRYAFRLCLPEIFDRLVGNIDLDRGPFVQQRPGLLDDATPVEGAREEGPFDVFFGYSDSDTETSGAVKLVLLRNGLAVYDNQQDVPQGMPMLMAWDHAMTNSSAFVLLLSPQYLTDPELTYQFQNVHNLVLEHEVNENRVLLLLTDDSCCLPDALRPLPVLRLSQDDWERQLEWWALRIQGQSTLRTFAKQMARDVGRDSWQLLVESSRDDHVQQQVLPGVTPVVRLMDARFGCGAFAALRPRLQEPQAKASATGSSSNTQNPSFPDDFHNLSSNPLWQAMGLSPARSAAYETGRGDESASDDVKTTAISESAPSAQFVTPFIVRNQRSESSPGHEETFPHRLRLSRGSEFGEERRDETGELSHHVFLTYCEESPSDCHVARQIKDALEGGCSGPRLYSLAGEGLKVYDSVRDMPVGEPEVHIVSAAALSAAFVVVISPAYCRDALTRRLHFPQVLLAVLQDRVPINNVLLVLTSGTLPKPARAEEPLDEDDEMPSADSRSAREQGVHLDEGLTGREERDELAADEGSDLLLDSRAKRENSSDPGQEDDEDVRAESLVDADDEAFGRCLRVEDDGDGMELPKWFLAFPRVHWSPVLGLYEEDRLRAWARRVYRQTLDSG